MTNKQPPTLGAQVKKIRNARKLSQTALAEMAGVSYRTIMEIEQGGDRWSKDKLNRIAAALGCYISVELWALPTVVIPEEVPDSPIDMLKEIFGNGQIREGKV